ncbi:MAG: tRNA glutamyl-Q(34) synthetase GluQRS [Cyanobium sp.]
MADPGQPLPLQLPAHLREQLDCGVALRQQDYRGRFAPSPTGPLHRGNLRTALLSWLAARLEGGEWLLRIDDLDSPRNRAGAEEELVADLRWLGLPWDVPLWHQIPRRDVYATVLSALRRAGWLYPCRCSRRLLADISAPHGAPPVYPGHCRGLGLGWAAEGDRLPSWRWRLPDGPILWRERFGPPGLLDGPSQVGDVVLRRADGFLAYHLATAVDELSLGISEVVRGEDLFWATGPQVALMGLLGAGPPGYGHVPLWRDGQGQRLSKREGAEGLAGMRRRGLDAPAVIGELAASAGLVPAGSRLSTAELLQELNPVLFAERLRAAAAEGQS